MAFKLIFALTLASRVTAHGFVKTIIADGTTYKGYDPSFQWSNPIPSVPGWSDPQNIANGFINDYSSPDLACHLGATPGKSYATVRAGGTVQLEWTPWPDSHKGPVLDYLAACNGDCTTVDKTTLLWNKIAESGLLDGSTVPGKFAADVLVQAGNKWSITIPASIAPGNYVLRHEIIALHEGGRQGGAQSYPQCINIKVTGGSGTSSLSGVGTPYNRLYTSNDPGILCNIYQKLSSYIIPGPALFVGGSSGSQSSSSIAATASSSTSTSKTSVSSSTTSAPSTFQTSTRATTTIAVPASTTQAAGGGSGTFYLSASGKARKFVCYEEL